MIYYVRLETRHNIWPHCLRLGFLGKTPDIFSGFQADGLSSQEMPMSHHSPTQMLADIGQVIGSCVGLALSGRAQLRERGEQRLELLLRQLPFVLRTEHDALHGMLQKARLEQAALTARLARLEQPTAATPAAAQSAATSRRRAKRG
jgi:BMFP domain-containing protein YqiC